MERKNESLSFFSLGNVYYGFVNVNQKLISLYRAIFELLRKHKGFSENPYIYSKL